MNPVSEERAIVIEQKLDKLTEAVTKLVLIDERQIIQGQRLGKVEEELGRVRLELAGIERKLDKWINMFWGGWGVAALVWTLAQKFF